MRVVFAIVMSLVLGAGPSSAQVAQDEPKTAPSSGIKDDGGTGANPGGKPGGTPARKATLDGTWSYLADCEKGTYDGVLSLAGGEGNFHLKTTGVRGPITSATLSGRSISMTAEYSFFGTVTEYWTAELDASGTGFSGSTYDTFGDNCRISATKQ